MNARLLLALISSFCIGPALTLAQSTPLPSFTAQSIQTEPDQPEKVGVIIKSDSMMRLEFEQSGQQVVQILRPLEGITLTLFPESQTYFEQSGPVQPQEYADSYTPPCPAAAEESGLQCTRIGLDTVSNIPVERWHIGTAEDENQMLILWDPSRKRALRQEMSNGTLVQMIFLEMQQISGRETEHWVTEISQSGATTLRNDWWYDPELKLVVQETLPGGTARRLQNIVVGPVDPAQFTVPDGWQPVTTANPLPQE